MKKLMSLCLALLLAVLVVPTVEAASTLPEAKDGKITLTEDVTLTSAFVVESGETLTLDLAGYTLKNDATLNADTIYVEKGATFTLTGDGEVINTVYGYAAILNNGTTVIDGATLKHLPVSGNEYYVILNHGIMTIEDANVLSTGTYSSLVASGYFSFTNSTNERSGYVEGVNHEEPTLTINGGNFDGGKNTIKNDDNGTLVINDGTFKNSNQVSIMNWNMATINGGTFETPTGNDKTNIFVGYDGGVDYDKGILVINGGTFNAEHLLESYTGLGTTVEINKGTFNYTVSFFNEENTEDATEVNGAEIKGNVTAPVSALKYAQSGASVTLNSELNVDDVITIPDGVEVTLPGEDKVLVENQDGTYTVAEAANVEKLLEILDEIDKINEDDYAEESMAEFLKLLETVKQEVEGMNFSKDEQEKVDEIVERLEAGMAKLVKVNPETADYTIIYLVMGIISIIGCGYVAIARKNN